MIAGCHGLERIQIVGAEPAKVFLAFQLNLDVGDGLAFRSFDSVVYFRDLALATTVFTGSDDTNGPIDGELRQKYGSA